jgi:hypothetical protein
MIQPPPPRAFVLEACVHAASRPPAATSRDLPARASLGPEAEATAAAAAAVARALAFEVVARAVEWGFSSADVAAGTRGRAKAVVTSTTANTGQ